MYPTLKSGTRIVINKAAYGLQNPFTKNYIYNWNKPQKDDIVTFFHNNKIVIKRCALIEEESLEFLVDSRYYLLIDKKNIPISEVQYLNLSKNSVVPKGYIFVLGDNFLNSVDSRDYGFVPIKSIKGKALIHE